MPDAHQSRAAAPRQARRRQLTTPRPGAARSAVAAARAAAARRWRPEPVRFLLVEEEPPAAEDRYFYFEDVCTQDSLFRHVATVVLGGPGGRDEKPDKLAALRDAGFFLVDLAPEPTGGEPLERLVPELVRRCRRLRPQAVILLKTTLFDLAARPLRDAGLPVVDVRVPFPGYGQRLRFLSAFREALLRAGAPVADAPMSSVSRPGPAAGAG